MEKKSTVHNIQNIEQLLKDEKEYSVGMEKYLNKLKENPNREDAISALIHTGVLDAEGNEKEQIVSRE